MYSGVIGLSRVSKLVSCFVLRFVYESFFILCWHPKGNKHLSIYRNTKSLDDIMLF